MSKTVPNFVGVTGLPRAGSTLLCQLLAQHPDIHCSPRSSALCNMLLAIRRVVSDDSFFLSQLDLSFDEAYGQLAAAMEGFLRGWAGGSGKAVAVDKNRAWLHCIEMLLRIAPEAKMLVCIRDLGQIYGSIEARHQKTILVDFIDHLADYDRLGRADMLFAKDKVIGAPLVSLAAVQDLPDDVKARLFFVRFEDLVADPVACMERVHTWVGVRPMTIDPNKLAVGVSESDSHYRGKYPHRQSGKIAAPGRHILPPRTQALIEQAYGWFYKAYYPDAVKR
jgi:sulfotransferase